MPSNADYLGVQKEEYRKIVPNLMNEGDMVYQLIMTRGDVVKSSTRAVNGPLRVSPPAAYRANGFDGQGLGRGTSSIYDRFQITPLGRLLAVETTALQEFATDSDQKAVKKAFEAESAYGIEEFRNAIDRELLTAGNGVEGTVSSVAGNTITLTSTPFGARLLRKTAPYQIYNAALTVNRGSFNVVDVNARLGQTQTILVDAVPAGTIATDVVVIAGLSGANPVGLYGIPYFATNSSVGTVMGISRGNNYMQANIFNAGNQALALGHFRQLWGAVKQAVGVETAKKQKALRWLMHEAQFAAYAEIEQAITRIMKQKGAGRENIDLITDDEDGQILGIPVKCHIYQDITRVDLLNLDTWGRAEWKAVDYYTLKDGTWLFSAYAPDGAPESSSLFYFACGIQFFVDNPLAIGAITSLAVPTGWV
ncbi:MAG TPA: hypothetical protein VNH83_25995 [Bryobacteraceae bacterium]|nr:hypothetical protein [Bryobacteraceae bacterium]